METETYLMLCLRLNYLRDSDIDAAQALLTEISKMITAIRTKLDE